MGILKKNKNEKDDKASRQGPKLGRREMMKFGAGAAAAGVLAAPAALAQQSQIPPISPSSPLAPAPHGNVQHFPDIRGSQEVITSIQPYYITKTGPGWKNESGRAFGNGPMDETTRRIVAWVDKFSFKDIDAKTLETLNYVQHDTLGAFYGGFESEVSRINARLSQTMPGPCTVWGYGIKTTYEMAAFTNGAMIRHTDFNTSPHNNEMFGGILAVGEALHSSGPDVLTAMAISYEVIQAIGNTGQGNYDPSGWDCPYHSVGTAMACGKLMKLNQDQLANAVSLALVPHMPLYVCHIGTQSHWKGTHSSEQVRNGVWAAMLAREGMTGPHMPFEARDGLWAHIGPPTSDLKFPTSPDGRLAVETIHGNGGGYKRVSTEGNNQTFHQTIAPEILKWTKPEEIASIDAQFHYFGWQEICDPLKWDPRNRETADHSAPYNVARMLLDGQIYLDSFTHDKYMDPKARELMAKITFSPNLDNKDIFVVTKKNGESKTFEGGRVPGLTHEELVAKYHKLADWAGVDKGQAQKAIDYWTNLKDCKDIGDAIALIAKVANPRPLSERAPVRVGSGQPI
jgi:2-methylcitrate dehydratase